jgi:hypothetical protein
MQSIKVKSRVDNDGILQISLPEMRDTDVEVTIVYQPMQQKQKRQWSSAFLSTFGAWQGESLTREPQEDQPEREPLL